MHTQPQNKTSQLIRRVVSRHKQASPRSFAQTLQDRYGVKLHLMSIAEESSEGPEVVRLNNISVPQELRNEGTGSKVMQELSSWADAHNIILSLTPSGDFGGSVTKLRRFYPRFGFVPNKGRNKDFRAQDTLIRYPTH